jgi:hypothetical protein
MRSCPIIFLKCCLALAAGVMPALPAAAQQTIQFTKPADQDAASQANAFMQTGPRRSASAYNAPTSLFGNNTPTASFDILPGAPDPGPAANTVSAAQWRKFLDGKKNWTLMTPEEILGVPTPEKILGLTDPKEDDKLSLEERFLQQQDNLTGGGATNGLRRPEAGYWRTDSATDPFHPADANSRFAENLGGTISGMNKNFNPLFSQNPDASLGENLKSDSAWANPFGMPEPLPKPTPDQLAGMERFRAIMEPTAPEKMAEPSRFSYQPAAAAPDPNLQALPAFNPNGRSFTPLGSGISRPIGIMPLPGLTGPPPPAKKASPLVQLPPWLNNTPQPFTPLQRQF